MATMPEQQEFSGTIECPECLRPIPIRIRGSFMLEPGVRVDHGERVRTMIVRAEHVRLKWCSIVDHFKRCHPAHISMITELERRQAMEVS